MKQIKDSIHIQIHNYIITSIKTPVTPPRKLPLSLLDQVTQKTKNLTS